MRRGKQSLHSCFWQKPTQTLPTQFLNDMRDMAKNHSGIGNTIRSFYYKLFTSQGKSNKVL